MKSTKQQRQFTAPAEALKSSYVIDETELWDAVDALRGSADITEYKHIILGLVFLKYTSDACKDVTSKRDFIQNIDSDKHHHNNNNTLWVPPEARWPNIRAQSNQPNIGKIIDDAMTTIEEENPAIMHGLPKNYANFSLDNIRLNEIIDLITNIQTGNTTALPGTDYKLGRVYEYLLLKFVNDEGRRGGEIYTPRCVVKLLVDMLEPRSGQIYDPCCGTGGMFVHLAEIIGTHTSMADISVYGQETNFAAWQLAKMNLATHGIDGVQVNQGDTLRNDCHYNLKFDYILASPPFNASNWGEESLKNDRRWAYGTPTGNANFAWVQHIVHHMSPSGIAGLVLSNMAITFNQASEIEIRKRLVEANLVDCIVSLPSQIFYSTQIPTCLWIMSKNHVKQKNRQQGQILFIDAREMGAMLDRTHRDLTDDEIDKISNTYRSWCNDQKTDTYVDVPGFCKSLKPKQTQDYGYILSPGHYIEHKPHTNDNTETFETKMGKLVAQWEKQCVDAKRLDAKISQSLKLLVGGKK